MAVLKKAPEDTTRINTLNNLFTEYEYTDTSKAAAVLNQSLLLAQKIGFKKGLIATYKNLGFFSEDVGNYGKALRYYQDGLKLSQELGDKLAQISFYNNRGIIYANQSNYPEALKNYFFCLKLSLELNHEKGIARSYNNIANIYKYQGNYPEALKHHFSSLKMNEAMGDQKGIAASYNNIGLIYMAQNNYEEALKNYAASLKINEAQADRRAIAVSYNNIANAYQSQGNNEEALKYDFMSLKISQEIGDNAAIAGSFTNIANVYTSLGNLDEALKNNKAALQILEALGNIAVTANVYNNMGSVYLLQKKFSEAARSFRSGLDLALKIGQKECLRNAYQGLSGYYEKTGNYREALENHKLYILYRDSLNNEETRKQTIQSQMTFDFEKREAVSETEHRKEIESQKILAEEKSRKQKMVIGLVALGLVLVLIFAVFVSRSLRVTKKQKLVIETQKDLVEHQKQEVEVQKHLVEEHQKEIIDSITYAKRIQRAILPSDDEIKKYLPDSFILYKPKDIVAGDFYWLEYKDDIVLIAAADSTGHGVPGAMVSVVCSNALNRAVNEFKLRDTGKILDKTRDLVLDTFAKSGEEIKDGMDISLLAIDKINGKIFWSGANNQLWYLPSEGEEQLMIEIKADKQPIGKTENEKPFKTHTFELKTGTWYYLLTDGYADQFGGEKGKKFKYRELQKTLLTHSALGPLEQKENLNRTFSQWKGDLEQVDDVTIIGIRV